MLNPVQIAQHHEITVEIQAADAGVVVAGTHVRHLLAEQEMLNGKADERAVAEDGDAFFAAGQLSAAHFQSPMPARKVVAVKYTARLSILLTMLGLCACGTGVQEADLVFLSGRVYTLNEAAPWAEAVAIRDGRIAAVGSDAEVTGAWAGPTIDLAGRMLLPGFHDAHVHPMWGGIQMAQCNLAEMASVESLLGKVQRCDGGLPEGEWLIGGGWNLALFPEANPGKELLDRINPARPMFLRGADGHSSWANSRALTLAGIESETPNPSHGIIERNEDGEPSGTLRESAQTLVEAILPVLTLEQRVDAAREAIRLANRLGITAMVEASASDWELDAYRALAAEGELSARLVLSMTVGENPIGASDPDLIAPQDRGTGKRIRRDAAKIFVDGVLEGETAALLEPYAGRDGAAGMLLQAPRAMNETVAALDARGVQVHFHAIGDRAVRAALDAVEHARDSNGDLDNRHHISHLQLVDERDHARFQELGVAANFQALWAYPDAYITDVNLPAVGAQRVQRMYPMGSIDRAGGMIVGGSDWSVSSLNPLAAIETAVTRQDATGVIDDVLNAAERVSLETMLAAYTRNAAHVMHHDDEAGTIEPGKLADLAVLERDLFETPVRQIGEVGVVMTLLEGAVVYDSGVLDQGITL